MAQDAPSAFLSARRTQLRERRGRRRPSRSRSATSTQGQAIWAEFLDVPFSDVIAPLRVTIDYRADPVSMVIPRLRAARAAFAQHKKFFVCHDRRHNATFRKGGWQ